MAERAKVALSARDTLGGSDYGISETPPECAGGEPALSRLRGTGRAAGHDPDQPGRAVCGRGPGSREGRAARRAVSASHSRTRPDGAAPGSGRTLARPARGAAALGDRRDEAAGTTQR